ncbi:MAG: homoaconitate hydratase [Proteobacteria bacterium]|nr:homoaconitate hydratase [Pseudomonadota bacterium]NOG59577.1 homoaconitate hydratase [Pseudomonadota bacterium]
MSTNIQPDQIWTSEYNYRDDIQSAFDHNKTIHFYDTTLRDGEQSVGVCFTPEEKFEIACKLDELGVSRIESGFPRVSEDDTRAVKRILDAGLNAEIWGFARCMIPDIDAHIELGTEHILIEISTSDLKMKAYGFDRDKVKERVANAVKHAKENGMKTVNFFAVDSTRSDLGFLKEVYGVAIDAGADEISLVDTIGACSPEAVEYLIGEVKSWFPGVSLHWHGHNDFGMATASAVAAVRAGADWVQGTINGMGERAGNADICEVALALQSLYSVPTNIDLSKAREISKIVQQAGNYTVDGWKPVVGQYLYTRESGAVATQFHIPEAIEPYSADIVAAERKIVLGKKSGLASIDLKGQELGIEIPDDKRDAILAEVKNVATRNARLISDDEFKNIVQQA